MRLWLNRTGEVSLREQLTTRVRLGILCHRFHWRLALSCQ